MVRRQVAGVPAGCLLALALACSGCGLPPPAATQPPGGPSPSASVPSARPAASPVSGRHRPQPLSCPARVFAQMTAASGSATVPGRPGRQPALGGRPRGRGLSFRLPAVRRHDLGQPDRDPADDRRRSVPRVRAATARVRFFIATDQEGGEVQRLREPGFSASRRPSTQGHLAAACCAQDAAGGARAELAGVNLTSPRSWTWCRRDRRRNQPIGALLREFGSDPHTVAATAWRSSRGWVRPEWPPPPSTSPGWAGSPATPTSPPGSSTR